MKKRLIVTGAKGFVAGSVVWQAGGDWDVHALVRSAVSFQRPGFFTHVFDLLDSERLRAAFLEIQPHAVIHAAAIADIDYCESHKDEAEAVNVGVTRVLAGLCRDNNVRLVHLSTDTVFDGEKGNYTEQDPTHPINYYAETKVAAENIVLAGCVNVAVPRLSLVMGLPLLAAGNSFLSRMIASLEQGREVGVPEDEIRTPVDVITLGRALLELAGNDYRGLIHLAGNDCMSRFDMSLRIADRLGFSRELIVAKNSGGMSGRAPRPRDASMNNSAARAALNTPMLGLAEGLELVLETK